VKLDLSGSDFVGHGKKAYKGLLNVELKELAVAITFVSMGVRRVLLKQEKSQF